MGGPKEVLLASFALTQLLHGAITQNCGGCHTTSGRLSHLVAALHWWLGPDLGEEVNLKSSVEKKGHTVFVHSPK